MIRKCLKVIGTVAAILVGVVAVYVIYLFTTYHRIADNLPLTVEQPTKKGTDVDALAIGTEYTALTYNIGFGAYTPDFSFFMDGGESSWAKSKESVLDTVQGAGDLVASLRPEELCSVGRRFRSTVCGDRGVGISCTEKKRRCRGNFRKKAAFDGSSFDRPGIYRGWN